MVVKVSMKLLLLLSMVGLSSGLTNVALGKPATMSSYHKTFGNPEKALDGHTGTYINQCTHTASVDNKPYRWFRVDLGKLWAIYRVSILNRGDCCADRLANFEVDVARSLTDPTGIRQATSVRCVQHLAAVGPGKRFEANCSNPIVGRYVTVILHSSTNPLHFCEFEVFADPMTKLTNVALGKPATMSSYHKTFGNPEKALDGHTGTYINQCTHTASVDNKPYRWFRVDLGKLWAIHRVSILNRGDCCADRLANFEVDVARSLTDPTGIRQATSVRCVQHLAAVGQGKRFEANCSNPIVGRYVTVILHSSTNPLHFCEFEVFAAPVADPCLAKPCQNEGTCKLIVNGIQLSYNCTCASGFTGPNCAQPADPCRSAPCQNGGQCSASGATYTCTCATGFQGDNCEQQAPCSSSPCQHGGECINNGASYTCACKRRYTGFNCETQIMMPGCESNPCQNEARCVDKRRGGYKCKCRRGYEGINCEIAPIKQPCDSNPCLNGAKCLDRKKHTPNYKCKCTEGYEGVRCETSTSEPPLPCDSNPCMHGAECVDRKKQTPNYKCRCLFGYEGVNCEKPFDKEVRPCHFKPCQNGGVCTNRSKDSFDYTCECPSGYEGTRCEIATGK